MTRIFPDWLSAFVDYTSVLEAPRKMYFWAGVSAIAGALRRRVWLDMGYFRWYANFFVILVAPPGIVSKSTTSAIALDLLRAVPGIKFGPHVVTWQALFKAFSEAREEFEYQGTYIPQSALTIESSEFGNLLNPQDREMVDMMVTLWDCKQGSLDKMTKMDGTETIVNPWLNIIACTTPAWIAGNFPEYMVGGGFTSRCIFVCADEKEKYVAYPGIQLPSNFRDIAPALTADLEYIANTLLGPYQLSPGAVDWGSAWYEQHFKTRVNGIADERFGGYVARKQTHIHKLAMVLCAATKDEMVITENELALANQMVTDLEKDMPKVFAKIGKSTNSIHAERFVTFIKQGGGEVTYEEAYRFIFSIFPDVKDMEGIVNGACRAGLLKMDNRNGQVYLSAL